MTGYGSQVARVAAGKKSSLLREANRPFRLDCDENLMQVLVFKTKTLVIIGHILADMTLQAALRELTNSEILSPVKRTSGQTVQWSQTKGSKFLLVEFSAVADGVVLLRMEYDIERVPER